MTPQPPTHPLLLSLMQYGYAETALETSSRQIFPIISYNLPHESVPKVHPGTSAPCLISDCVFEGCLTSVLGLQRDWDSTKPGEMLFSW